MLTYQIRQSLKLNRISTIKLTNIDYTGWMLLD